MLSKIRLVTRNTECRETDKHCLLQLHLSEEFRTLHFGTNLPEFKFHVMGVCGSANHDYKHIQ